MKPLYTPSQTRHTPTVFIKRGGDVAVAIAGEPACGAPIGPGTTTILDSAVTCKACVELLARRH